MRRATGEWVPLVQAAALLKERYQRTYDRVLSDELRGEQREGRKWFVEPTSLDKAIRAKADRQATTATAA